MQRINLKTPAYPLLDILNSKFYFNQYPGNCCHVKPSLTIPTSLASYYIIIVAYSFKEHIQNNLMMSKNTLTISTSVLFSFPKAIPFPHAFPLIYPNFIFPHQHFCATFSHHSICFGSLSRLYSSSYRSLLHRSPKSNLLSLTFQQ